MIAIPQRRTLLALISEACAGARLHKACAVVGLATRTVQRWLRPCAATGDRRTAGQRTPHVPANKFTQSERQIAMDTLSSDAFKDLPPCQIVPRLADLGRYVGSESTLYRLLRQPGQLAHRNRQPASATTAFAFLVGMVALGNLLGRLRLHTCASSSVAPKIEPPQGSFGSVNVEVSTGSARATEAQAG